MVKILYGQFILCEPTVSSASTEISRSIFRVEFKYTIKALYGTLVFFEAIIGDAPVVVSHGISKFYLKCMIKVIYSPVVVDDSPFVLLQVLVGNGPVVVSLCQVGVGHKAGYFRLDGDNTVGTSNSFLIFFDF